MKNIVIAAVGALALTATPALARDFEGLRAEVTAGADNVIDGVDTTEVTYGAGVGYDKQFGKFVVGAEVTADNVFDRRDFGAAIRAGFTPMENVLFYGKVGYANWKQIRDVSLDGFRVGGGLEVNVLGPVYGKIEYRYSDFEAAQGKHSGLVGVGLRF